MSVEEEHQKSTPDYVKDRRRYKRMHARIPLRITAGDPKKEVTTVTVDISTGGGSFELPVGEFELTPGDTITVELHVNQEDQEFFTARAIVRYARRLPPSEDAPPLMRYGVQFREALLLISPPPAS